MEERESRKRKVEKDEDEEEKMEKFFALIRSTRDVRKRMIISGVEEEKKKKGEEEKPVGVWNPSFQPEDFMEGGAGSQASLAGPPKRQGETKEEDKGLDLNLSL